jgi:hypothetical protein
MNPAFDTADTNGGDFEAQQAAALLNQTTQQTRRQLEPFPPWLVALRALLALAAYGAIWLSVRGQHPYMYPTAAIGPAEAAIGIVNVIALTAVAKRATTGVFGRSRFRPGEVIAMVVIWTALIAGMFVLAGAGVSNSIAFGLYPAAAPLIVCGLAWAILKATQGMRRGVVTGLAAVVIGGLSLLAGPAGCWAVCAVGLCALLLIKAAVTAWRQRS